MMKTKQLPKTLDRLKKDAKSISKTHGLSHTKALELIAREIHFPNWKAVLKADKEYQSIIQSTREIKNNTPIADQKGHLHDLPMNKQILVMRNMAHFSKAGIEYAMFKPTVTGLKKSILDATGPVRSLFEIEGFHNFITQGQGKINKKEKKAYLIQEAIIVETKVSLYRPETKHGDPRMWFSGLPKAANPNDQVAIIILYGAAYLFNFSRFEFDTSVFVKNLRQSGVKRDHTLTEPGFSVLSKYLSQKNLIAEELLNKLKEIAKKPLKAPLKGDTAIGMAIESALGIKANSSKKPDYKGIEIKSGRKTKNRTTLFAQVCDWKHPLGICKSSSEILDLFGYDRSGDFKLYCTVSTKKENSQGLKFIYDETSDTLIEKHGSLNVALWSGSLLRKRLLEKHSETFWIDAKSIQISGNEHFELLSVTHTKRPLENQLLPLIQSGIVTMDHLIKRKGGNKPRISEKGPLFKIDRGNLELLFPAPKTYSLK